MVDLKKNLEEYLLLQSDQKKTFKLQMPSIETTNITGWFRKEPIQEEEHSGLNNYCQCFPTLSRFQQLTFFILCLGLSFLCFLLSSLYIPVLLLKARKFALLFTLGSTFFILSFFFLWGPMAFIRCIFAREKLLMTITYGGSLAATLFCALGLQSLPLTVLFAVFQILILIWSLMAVIPRSGFGFSFIKKILYRASSTSLPI